MLLNNRVVGPHFVAPVLVRVSLLEREIMRNAKDPPAKISVRPATLQMSEQGQEHFLDHFFRIVHRYSKRECISQQRVAKLIEETHNLALYLSRLRGMRWGHSNRERQLVD